MWDDRSFSAQSFDDRSWGLLSILYAELKPKQRVALRSALEVFYSTEATTQIIAYAAENGVSAVEAAKRVTAKQTALSVEAVRRTKKSRIDPAATRSTTKRPVEQVTTKIRAQTVFSTSESIHINATAQTAWLAVVQQAKPIHAIRGEA